MGEGPPGSTFLANLTELYRMRYVNITTLLPHAYFPHRTPSRTSFERTPSSAPAHSWSTRITGSRWSPSQTREYRVF